MIGIHLKGMVIPPSNESFSDKFTYTGDYEFVKDGGRNWKIRFLTSGVFTPLVDVEVDIFAVGGGAGSALYIPDFTSSNSGGGGGYTTTVKKITLLSGHNYTIEIGKGGKVSDDGLLTNGEPSAVLDGQDAISYAAGAVGYKGGSGGSSASMPLIPVP